MIINLITKFIIQMAQVAERNEVEVLADASYRKNMKIIQGFDGLLKVYKDLPKVGGFYVDECFVNEKEIIKNSNYYLAESEEEDEDMEDEYKTWLEYPTFKDIIDNKIEHHPNSSKNDFLEAVIYYLENDDFLD